LKIAIFEFVCSSGLFQVDGTDCAGMALLEEGAAMLVALCNDLTSSSHRVTTSIEGSIAAELKGRQVVMKSDRLLNCSPLTAEGEEQSEVQQLDRIANRWRVESEDCDAVIVIAPEIDGILSRLVHRLRSFGVNVIASDQRFLDCATDKWETAQAWNRHSLQTIPTWLATDWYKEFQLGQIQSGALGMPTDGWVIKRRLGAGGIDLLRFRHADDLAAHIQSLLLLNAEHKGWDSNENLLQGATSTPESFIVQPWVCGQASSLAVLACEGRRMCLLGAMDQLFGPAGSYVGGVGPLDLPSDRLESFAMELLRAIPGVYKGWIGIDFVRTSSDDWYPLEINARLTSSYLGYRQGYGPRLADGILGLADGSLDSPLPRGNSLIPGTIRFSVTEFHG
jgi:predicted ATP-grasp superfamily ATP-dependent carboligase